MITRYLWRAEWLKTRKRPVNIGMLALMLGLLTAIFVISTGLALYDPATHLEEASGMLPWPFSLDMALDMSSELGVLLAIIFVANSVGSEYTRDTWKIILPRYGSRIAFIFTKMLALLVSLLLLTVLLAVWAVVLGALCTLILGLDLTTASKLTFGELAWEQGASGIEIAFYSMLTMLATILMRSTIGGAVVGFIAPQVLNLFSFLSTTLALVLPVAHLENIGANSSGNDELVGMIAGMMGREVSAEVSLAVVLGYIALFIAVSLWVFKKRDMAGG